MRLIAVCLMALLFTTACATRKPVIKGTPSRELSTPYTLKSGGQVAPLQQGITVAHADLWFNFDFRRKVLYGTTTLSLESERPRRTLSVDLDTRFKVEKVWINGTEVPPGNVRNPDGQLLITPPLAVTFPLKLKIQYYGQPRKPPNAPWDGGVLWQTTPSGLPWVTTAVQGQGCDLFWPCIDQPFAEPQRADIHITVPPHLTAASNGTLLRVTSQANAKTYHWRSTTPINTYGIALNIGPFEAMEGSYQSRAGETVPMVYYYLPGNVETRQARLLFEQLPPMLRFMERTIGPYPFSQDKIGLVQTPYLGMEHQTINAYGNNYKQDDNSFDWLLQHELAHEWFGNQMTGTDWDHLWLHESLGTYMQPLYAGHLDGPAAYRAYMDKLRSKLNNRFALVSGNSRAEHEVANDQLGPGLDVYYKGAWMLHSLRHLIGDKAFFAAVRELVYGTPEPNPDQIEPLHRTTNDFIRLVNKHSGRTLHWFFDVYLYQPELPVLEVTRTDTHLVLNWQVPGKRPFPMPVEVTVNGKLHTIDMLQSHRLAVPKNAQVKVDPQQRLLRFEKSYDDPDEDKKTAAQAAD